MLVRDSFRAWVRMVYGTHGDNGLMAFHGWRKWEIRKSAPLVRRVRLCYQITARISRLYELSLSTILWLEDDQKMHFSLNDVYSIPMRSLSEREALTGPLLEPYAVPVRGGLGRVYEEAEDTTRFPFQRDRDRILHTQAFRRLKHKTQVFVSGHGDHYRTRITHTLEVAQISRDIARTMGLNEDLAESIALAHDLGHTPFGHAGESAMDECLKEFGHHFEHNEQSLRVVRLLESRTTQYPGLNVSCEILEGLLKHRTPHDHPDVILPRSPSLEAQVVNLADEIAYTAHDTDDGLRAGLFTVADVAGTALGRLAHTKALERATELRGAIVHLLVSDVYAHVGQTLMTNKIHTLDDVYRAKAPLVTFSSGMDAMLAQHRDFLWERLYKSPAVLRQAESGRKTIKKLYAAYMAKPPTKVKELQKRTESELYEAVKDYIAGMTDTFAVEQLAAL